MSLYPYAARCREFESEIASTLSAVDRDVLRNDVAELGPDGWMRWIYNNREALAEYVAAVPSRRAKLKKWRDPDLRPRLAFGAIQLVHAAFLLLDGIDSHRIYAGLSYRDMASDAGLAFLDIFLSEEMPLVWPFEDPDPFEEVLQ